MKVDENPVLAGGMLSAGFMDFALRRRISDETHESLRHSVVVVPAFVSLHHLSPDPQCKHRTGVKTFAATTSRT
jgi:hypothetical protein